jgi:hypothetical protein
LESSTGRSLSGLRGFSIRLEPRLDVRPWLRYAVPLASLVVALILGMVPIVMQGINPIVGYRDMVLLAFGSAYGISETIMKAIPLMLAGLGVALAFRMLVWNIGAEGQLYMGAFASCLVAYTLPVGGDSWRSQGFLGCERDHHQLDAELHRHTVGQLPGHRAMAGSEQPGVP